MDIVEADSGIGPLCNLIFEPARLVQALSRRIVIRTNDFPRLVVYAKHQPRSGETRKVGLVRECREILADIPSREALAAALKFDDFILPLRKQRIQQRSKLFLRHPKPPFKLYHHLAPFAAAPQIETPSSSPVFRATWTRADRPR